MTAQPNAPAEEMPWLQQQVQTAGVAFADQLRSVSSGSTPVPGLDWDVAELGAHMVSMPKVYKELNVLGDAFETPSDWAVFSKTARAHITETDPTHLADMVMEQIEALFQDLGPDASAPRMLYGQATTSGNIAAGYMSELLLHGMDLGKVVDTKVTGATASLDDRQARAVIPGMMCLTPVFLDPAAVSKCTGTYGVHFRGAGHWTWTVANGAMVTEQGRPAKADARMVANPREFVLSSLGRMGQVKASVAGRFMAYGRKPWMFLLLGNAKSEGV